MIEKIILNEKLSIEERVLVCYIILNEREDNVFTNQELMNVLGCAKTKLIKVKKGLEQKQILKQQRTFDNSNKYFISNMEVNRGE